MRIEKYLFYKTFGAFYTFSFVTLFLTLVFALFNSLLLFHSFIFPFWLFFSVPVKEQLNHRLRPQVLKWTKRLVLGLSPQNKLLLNTKIKYSTILRNIITYIIINKKNNWELVSKNLTTKLQSPHCWRNISQFKLLH